jgi:hypothetical protein
LADTPSDYFLQMPVEPVRISAATLLAAFACIAAFAQSDLSTITGVVKDPSGSAVPGAKINVLNEATGVGRQTISAESGTFSVTNLPSGFYSVTVEGQGFKKFQTTRNKLDASVPLAVDVSLEVGGVTETVNVVADSARIQTETATVGALVDEAQIKNIDPKRA